jgi:hypothetical protein
MMMRVNYKTVALSFFLLGTVLRILLCWANPPGNAFDNHFKPIFMIMESGTLPAKDACWQCYHPPVFYWGSAMIGNAAVAMGATFPILLKLLQFISCFYGILTLAIIYLILRKLPLSGFSRLIALGTICFLPRHIYMSAMNSNDTISYLFVSLSIYSLFLAIERKLSPFILLVASIVISITLFTKYTSYVVLVIILTTFGLLFYKRLLVPRRKVVLSLILILLIPMTLLSVYWVSNMKHYGSPLPWNVSQLDPSLSQPRDSSGLDFISFTPWDSLSTPIIVPGKMHSFWTLVYSGMWFDTEPKFLYFLDSNQDWWKDYYAWLRGEKGFPGDNLSMSSLTTLTGSGLTALGLLPLLLIIFGFYNYFRGRWKPRTETKGMDGVRMSTFPALLLSNAAGVIALAIRLPVYSAMKASYFLNSLPAFAVFLSLGLMPCENNKTLKWTIMVVLGFLFALVSLHILHIVLSLV